MVTGDGSACRSVARARETLSGFETPRSFIRKRITAEMLAGFISKTLPEDSPKAVALAALARRPRAKHTMCERLSSDEALYRVKVKDKGPSLSLSQPPPLSA